MKENSLQRRPAAPTSDHSRERRVQDKECTYIFNFEPNRVL
jgi:hypothetical protein